MSVIAWWVVPVLCALAVGGALSLWNHRPQIGGAFEEVEHFQAFQHALEQQVVDVPRQAP